MKMLLTHKSIKGIISDYDIEYINNNNKPNGEVNYERYNIIINIANQPIKEMGISLLHEFLHVLYDNNYVHATELQIEMEARRYYEKTSLLDFIHSFL